MTSKSKHSKNQKKRRRTETIDVHFKNGLAEGWMFGVPAAFKVAMDIRNLEYVDKERTTKLRKARGGKHDENGKLLIVYRTAETRGQPPSRSYKEGDIFYSPAEVRPIPWSEALVLLKQAVQIIAASPDDDKGTNGWVEIVVYHYQKGEITAKSETQRLSQKDFETLLKTGFSAPTK